MTTLDKITITWQEDGSATALARVCARDATGAAIGVLGEGNWIKQADLSTITCKVFDRSGATPDIATAAPAVSIPSVILDAPVTNGLIWDVDNVGYNFLCDLAGTNFPTGGHKYLVAFYFTTTGGSTWAIQYEGIASPVAGD